jgi:hypothetical protein
LFSSSMQSDVAIGDRRSPISGKAGATNGSAQHHSYLRGHRLAAHAAEHGRGAVRAAASKPVPVARLPPAASKAVRAAASKPVPVASPL